MDFLAIRAGHLWFMINLLICYPILYLMEKYHLQKVFYLLLRRLLVAGLFLLAYLIALILNAIRKRKPSLRAGQ